MAFSLPDAYPITGVGIVALLFLDIFQILQVSKNRKLSGVKYPNLYASDAEAAADPKKYKFNCAQRSHANTLEYVPYVLALFGYLSLFQPKFATGALCIWVAGRYMYTVNYNSGNPAARNKGLAGIAYLGLFPLMLGTIYQVIVEVPKVLKL